MVKVNKLILEVIPITGIGIFNDIYILIHIKRNLLVALLKG
jgi:hypothetical protein